MRGEDLMDKDYSFRWFEDKIRGQVLIIEPKRLIGGCEVSVEINDHEVTVWMQHPGETSGANPLVITNVLRANDMRRE